MQHFKLRVNIVLGIEILCQNYSIVSSLTEVVSDFYYRHRIRPSNVHDASMSHFSYVYRHNVVSHLKCVIVSDRACVSQPDFRSGRDQQWYGVNEIDGGAQYFRRYRRANARENAR